MKRLVPLLFITLLICTISNITFGDPLKDYLSTFIPTSCCYTNSCCWEITKDEVVDKGSGLYTILSTGQDIFRKDFSPDGKYWRCACDLVSGEWVKHQGANTRCLFTPFQGY